MAKKKKKIIHMGVGGKYLCGISKPKEEVLCICESLSEKEYQQRALNFNGRLCHKCKHTHKLNLKKVK